MKKLCTIFTAILLLCGGMDVLAQTNKFTNGTEGTEFWFSFPVAFPEQGGNNGLKIYVSCEVATQCTLEIPGLGKKVVRTTKPNDIIDFTLFPGEGQPYESMGVPGTAKSEDQTYLDGKGKGIHIYADVPITVYGVSRYTYTSDSFIALPTSSLGTEYIIASYADMSGTMFQGYHLPSQAVIVAAHDSTTVSFTLGGSDGTETVSGMKRGETKTFKLNKGDIVAFANKKINGFKPDISGSTITSDKPIAVTSGNQCANIAVDNQWCDFIMEMELPTQTWGKEYHVTRFTNRKNYSYIKVFAKEPNTKLYRDGDTMPFAVLTTAGGRQHTGYFEGRVMADGSTPRPIVIRGDKPISISQFNPGQQEDNVASDPFQLVLTPIEQYQKAITFNTPGVKGGQGFKQNYVNLVFEANTDGSMPDDLEFGILQNDTTVNWRSVRSVFGAVAEPFKGFAGDTKRYYAKIITLPGDGVYKFRALKPFAAYSYGFDSYDSYGHPTSLITNDLTSNDSLPPMIVLNKDDGASATFTVQDGGGQSSKISRIFLNASSSANYRLKTDNFISGQAQTVNVLAEVINPFKDAKAEIVVVDRAGNHSLKTLSYKGKDVIDNVAPIPTFVMQQCSVCTEGVVTDFPNDSILRSNIATISLQEAGSFNYTLETAKFVSGKSTSVKWTACVEDISINASAVIYFADAAGNDTTIVLWSYSNGGLPPYKTLLNYGTLKANQSTQVEFGFHSIAEYSQYITSVKLTSGKQGFKIVTPVVLPDTILKSQERKYIIDFVSPIKGIFRDTVMVEVNGCLLPYSYLEAIVEGPSDVERVYDPSFNISPNPATGFTTINLPLLKSQNPLLKIYDALGNEVADYTGKVTGNYSSFNVDTRSLPNGAYFVRFTDGTYTLVRTFIVNN